MKGDVANQNAAMPPERFIESVTDAVVALEGCSETGAGAVASLFEECLGAYADAVLTREDARGLAELLDATRCRDLDAARRVAGEWRFAKDGHLVIDPERGDTLKTLYVAELIRDALEATGQIGEEDAFAMKVWLNDDRDKVDLVARGGRYHILGATVGGNTIPPEMVEWLNLNATVCMLEGREALLFFARTLQGAAAAKEGEELWRFVLELIRDVGAGRTASSLREGEIAYTPVVRERAGRFVLEPAPVTLDAASKGRVLKEVEVVRPESPGRPESPLDLVKALENAVASFTAWADEDATEKADRLTVEFLGLLRRYANSTLTRETADAFMDEVGRHVEDVGTVRAVARFLTEAKEGMRNGVMRVGADNNLAMLHAALVVSVAAGTGKRGYNRIQFWIDDARNHVTFYHSPGSGKIYWRGVAISGHEEPGDFAAYVEENLPFFEMEETEIYARYVPWLNRTRASSSDPELCAAIYEDAVRRCNEAARNSLYKYL